MLYAENGSEIIKEKRNIHFMKVTTLYLDMSGRKIPRYKAKLRELSITSITPEVEVGVAELPMWMLWNIRNMTPQKLRITPPAFLKVMGSCRKMAAMNMVMMGVMVLMIDKSMGEVRPMAVKNVICGKKSPKREAPMIGRKSFFATFSFVVKRDNIQNMVPAPIARNVNSAIGGSTPPFAISLQNLMLNPNMAYAANPARCPNNILYVCFSFIFYINTFVLSDERITAKEHFYYN